MRGEDNRTGRRLLPKSEEGRLKEPVLRVPVAGRRLEEPFQGHCRSLKGCCGPGQGRHTVLQVCCAPVGSAGLWNGVGRWNRTGEWAPGKREEGCTAAPGCHAG